MIRHVAALYLLLAERRAAASPQPSRPCGDKYNLLSPGSDLLNVKPGRIDKSSGQPSASLALFQRVNRKLILPTMQKEAMQKMNTALWG